MIGLHAVRHSEASPHGLARPRHRRSGGAVQVTDGRARFVERAAPTIGIVIDRTAESRAQDG